MLGSSNKSKIYKQINKSFTNLLDIFKLTKLLNVDLNRYVKWYKKVGKLNHTIYVFSLELCIYFSVDDLNKTKKNEGRDSSSISNNKQQ